MKGYRFYLEYPNKTEKNKGTVKKPGNHTGNVLALILDETNSPLWWIGQGKQILFDCISAVHFYPNSPVCGGFCNNGYLQNNCKRIPERLAREVHPQLFECLDEPEV